VAAAYQSVQRKNNTVESIISRWIETIARLRCRRRMKENKNLRA
jgi:hypothetical protein